MAVVIPICSNKPRASTRTSGKGNHWWRRDVFHIQSGDKTACGLDAEGWLKMDPAPLRETLERSDCCKRCAAVAAINFV